MNSVQTDAYSVIPARLAAAILLRHGEISFGEIRALPLVEDEQAVLAIADLLAHQYEVTRFGRWEVDAPATRFEDVIRLIEPVRSISARQSKRRAPKLTQEALFDLREAGSPV